MIKNRIDNETVKDKYKNIETDFTKFNDNVTPNGYIGINSNDVMLKWSKIGS